MSRVALRVAKPGLDAFPHPPYNCTIQILKVWQTFRIYSQGRSKHWSTIGSWSRPAFEIVGKKTWIPGQGDNEAFGRFWAESQREGLLDFFRRLSGHRPGAQTGGVMLGISRVEHDPSNRAFYYMIAIEKPEGAVIRPEDALESYTVPATTWAVFECHGKLPEAIVASEMYALWRMAAILRLCPRPRARDGGLSAARWLLRVLAADPQKGAGVSEKRAFRAVMKDAGDGGAFVTVPFDVEATFGKKRVKVKATIEGEPYRGSLVRMGAALPPAGSAQGDSRQDR